MICNLLAKAEPEVRDYDTGRLHESEPEITSRQAQMLLDKDCLKTSVPGEIFSGMASAVFETRRSFIRNIGFLSA